MKCPNSLSLSIIETEILGLKKSGTVAAFSISVRLNVSWISCETPSTRSVKKTGTNGVLAVGLNVLLDTVKSLPTSG